MSSFTKLRHILDRPTKTRLVLLLFGIMAGAMLEMLALAVISPFITVLIDLETIHTTGYLQIIYDFFGFQTTTHFLALFTFILAAVYIFRGVYLYILNRVQFRFIAARQAVMSGKLLKKILKYSYLFHLSKNFAELQRIVILDVNALFILTSHILFFLTDLFVAFFIFIFLIVVSPAMTALVAFLAGVFIFAYMKKFRKKIISLGEEHRVASIASHKALQQGLNGIKEVKILSKEDYFHSAFMKSSIEFVQTNTKYNTLQAVPRLFIETVCFGGVFLFLGILMIGGMDISGLVPQISLFVLAAFRLLPAVTRMTNYANTVIFHKFAINAVYENMYEINDIVHPFSESDHISDLKDITVSSVSFSYPQSNETVLKDVSFTIPDKKSVAIIGASGVGKTTLIDIILGIITPEKGDVYFGNKSVYKHFDEWSKEIGYIPQQIYLLDESIRENIAFGIESNKIKDEDIWKALETAQLKSFVENLPQGLDTLIGEHGTKLSGGQRQRLSIARALYTNPSVLVMDEATSSLDNETEDAVMAAIKGLQGEKTIIIIAHRL